MLDLNSAVETFASSVRAHERDILKTLTTQCTLHSAQIELEQALKLSGNLSETVTLPTKADTGNVFSFLPRNNLLYSMALYALIPLALGYEVTLRAPASLRSTVRALWNLSGLERVSRAYLHLGSQRDFTAQFTTDDIILFTGQSSNGKEIESTTPHRLFLGFGASHNPFLVMPGAPLEKLVEDLIFARMYNAGADCLAPDIILVQSALIEPLKAALIAKLKTLPALEQSDADVIAHTNSPDAATAERAMHIINAHQHRVVWCSAPSDMRNYVPTSVIHSDIENPLVAELFAPVFNIVEFREWDEVTRLLRGPGFRASEMYLSLYGEAKLGLPGEYFLCQDSSPFDHESALSPFGGYGPRATWRTFAGVSKGQPISVFHELGGES